MVGTFNHPLAWLLLVALTLGSAACQQQEAGEGAAADSSAKKERIITLGGPVTEVVYALGAGDQVIATDISSTWPPEVASLKKLATNGRFLPRTSSRCSQR